MSHSRIQYSYNGKLVYIASDFGDGEVAVHPEGLDNEDADIVQMSELKIWNAFLDD